MSRLEQDAAGRPLHRLANALLARGLPRIRALLERRLGPDAAVEALTLEGSLVCVDRARIPLGARACLQIERASISIEPRGLIARRALDLRLLAPRATVRIEGERARTIASQDADVDLVTLDDLVVDLTFAGAKVSWRASARYDAASIEAHGAFVMGAGRGDTISRAITARFEDVSAVALDRLVRLGGAGAPAFTPPGDVRVAGELTFFEDGATTGAVTFTTPRSSLTLEPLCVRQGRIESCRLQGSLGLADALTIGLFPSEARLGTESLHIRVEQPGPRPKSDLWIPGDARLFGEVSWAQDQSLAGTIGVETPRSSLLLQLAMSPDRGLAGSTLRGRLAIADALLSGLFDTAIRPLPEGSAQIEAAIGGTPVKAVISGRATASELRFGLDGSAASPTARVEDVTVLFSIDPERIVWRNLQARIYGGTFGSSGLIASGPSFTGLQSSVWWSGVLVEQIPGGPGVNEMGDSIRGRLSGEMRLDRRGAGSLTGRGHAELADPDYRFLAKAQPALAAYELPIPPTRSAVPLRTLVRLSEKTILLSELRASVDGCSIEGAATIGPRGELRGLLHAHIEERLLSRSPLLSIPAAFTGDVVVPVTLGGSLERPRFEADLVGALERLVTNNNVGSAIRGAVGELWSAISWEPAERRGSIPDEVVDRIADRIIAGDPESDHLMRELVDAGVDIKEFGRLLERRRRKRVRVRI